MTRSNSLWTRSSACGRPTRSWRSGPATSARAHRDAELYVIVCSRRRGVPDPTSTTRRGVQQLASRTPADPARHMASGTAAGHACTWTSTRSTSRTRDPVTRACPRRSAHRECGEVAITAAHRGAARGRTSSTSRQRRYHHESAGRRDRRVTPRVYRPCCLGCGAMALTGGLPLPRLQRRHRGSGVLMTAALLARAWWRCPGQGPP